MYPRKIPLHTVLLVATTATGISGCSQFEARRVDPLTGSVEKAAGVTYYLSKPTFKVELLGTAGGKKAQTEYRVVLDYVADHTQRYEIGLDTGLFSSDIFEVNLTDDGRLVGVNAESTDTTPEYIKALGEVVVSALDVAALSKANHYEDAIDYAVAKNVSYNPAGGGTRLPVDSTVANALKIAKSTIEKPPMPLDATSRSTLISVQPALQAIAGSLGSELKKSFDSNNGIDIAADTYPNDQLSRAHQWKAVFDATRKIKSLLQPSAKPSLKELATYFKKLHIDAQIQLAEYVTSNGASGDPSQGKIKEYRNAVAFLLKAHEAMHGNQLAERRKGLTDFLAEPINAPANPSVLANWYSDFRAELDHVNSEITKLIPSTASAKTVVSGTEATRIFDTMEAVYLPRHIQADPDELMVLGEAYWRFGVSGKGKTAGLDGIIFYYEEK